MGPRTSSMRVATRPVKMVLTNLSVLQALSILSKLCQNLQNPAELSLGFFQFRKFPPILYYIEPAKMRHS